MNDSMTVPIKDKLLLTIKEHGPRTEADFRHCLFKYRNKPHRGNVEGRWLPFCSLCWQQKAG